MFRTVLKTKVSGHKIAHDKNILSMGSCFATMMGGKLLANKFNAETNPFGVIFNPVSIFRVLNYAVKNTFPKEDTYVKNQDVWYNYDLHSDYSNLDRDALKKQVESKIVKVHHDLQNTSYLIITLGTAYVYSLDSNDTIVANCHKLPAASFTKRLLKVDEIVRSFNSFIENLSKINHEIKIILTVSPVRHIKDTLELNAVSKSVLRLAAHKITETCDHVNYFPSYEIMMDDLRDYRFYKPDMLHPSEVAEKYIWEQFMDTYFSQEIREVIKKWQKIKQALEHKPFHPDSPSHQRFLKETLGKVKALHEKINLSKEINVLEARINLK